MKIDGHLVAKRGSQVWSYVDWSIGNTDVPYEFLECIDLHIDPEGTRQGLYD